MIKKWLKSKNQSWRGPLLTILAGFILSAITGLTSYQLPLATAIFLLIIIYAAFTGSLLSSLISVLLAIGFTLTTLMPGGLLSFGERDLERLAVLSLGASLIALLIANFKQRTDQAITLKLKQQQQQLQAVLDNSTANIYLKDRQGHYLLINRQIERLFGLKNEEVVGKTDQELFPQNYVQQWNTNDRQVLATANPVEIEEDALQADGLHTYISVKFPLVDEHGEVYALGGISTDITELKQASQLLEQRVAERTAELTTLLKISRNVVGTLDLKSIAKLLLIQLSQLLKYDVALLSIYENDRFRLVDALVNSQRPSLESLAPLVASSPRLNEMLKLKKPLVIEDLAVNNSRLKQVGEQANVDLDYFHAALIIPLSVKEQVVGMLVITHRTVGYFTPHYAQLAQTIANQIAIAIENARLYEQAQKLAALEERQRLARELHDSTLAFLR